MGKTWKHNGVTWTSPPQHIVDLENERRRQDAKWGVQDHDPFLWMTVLGEEFGEASKAALHMRFNPVMPKKVMAQEYRAELIQVAAVAMAAIECLDRNEWRWGVDGRGLEAPLEPPTTKATLETTTES